MRENFELPDEPEFDLQDDADVSLPSPKKLSELRATKSIPRKEPELINKKQKNVETDLSVAEPKIERTEIRSEKRSDASDRDDGVRAKVVSKAMPTKKRLTDVRHRRNTAAATVPENHNEKKAERHYARISNFLRHAKFVTLIALALYVALNLIIYSDSITYENAKMLFYDFQNAISVGDADVVDVINVPGDSQRSALVFRGEICTVGASGISLWQTDGKQVLNDEKRLYSPSATCNDRYIIFYDRGYNNYYIYNSFSLIYEGETDFPITDVSTAENGDFALLTRTREYVSAIEVYSSSFKLKQRIRTDSFVLFTRFNKKGNILVSVSLSPHLSTYDTQLTYYRIGDSSSSEAVTLEGEFVYDISFFGDDILALASSGIYCIDEDGNVTKLKSFDGVSPSKLCLSESVCAVVFENEGQNGELFVLDAKKNIMRNIELEENVSDVVIGASEVFVLTESKIIALNVADGKCDEYDIEYGAEKLLVLSNSAICAVRSDRIDCIRLD